MTFVQANLFTEHNWTQSIGLCSIEFGSRTQSNTIPWIEFDWVQFVQLNSIGSEIELTQSSVIDFVRLPESIVLNPWIEFDWVRFPKVRLTMPGRTRENGMTLFGRNKISTQTEAFHLRFNRNFCYSLVKWDWNWEFLKMERHVSVGPDWPVKEHHLWRWTTLSGKFPLGPKCSIYVLPRISGNFSIMESTQDFQGVKV